MPFAAKKRATDPDGLYVAWESFTTAVGITVRAGTRLRGDHEAVQGWPQYFLPADTPDDEVQRHRAQAYAEELAKVAPLARRSSEEHVRVLEPPEPLRDEDAVVAIRFAGVAASVKVADPTGRLRAVNPGERLPRDHPMVKRDPGAFVEICNGVPRDRAMVALQYMSNLDSEGNLVREVYSGQWLDRDDLLAQVNPHMVRRVGFE